MSLITLQLGQCGNQVGGQLFSTIVEDIYAKSTGLNSKENQEYMQKSLDTFFSEPEKATNSEALPQARAVLVDMESKAIAQTLQQARKSGRWSYSSKQSFNQKRGSGNNWAHGFCVHGPRCREDVMELVRREAEKCDRLGGFVSLLSLAGGTGSGVGAFVTESLREEYPHSFILNQVVWPYSTGEVIVQNYNAMLTLSHLYNTVDALVVMENDALHKICARLLNMKNISFEDINRVISHKLATVLQPSNVEEIGCTTSCDLGFLMERLVGHPQYKLLTVKNIPQMADNAREFSFHQWPGLVKNLRQMLIADSPMEEGINWEIRPTVRTENGNCCFNRALSSALILRGQEVRSVDTSLLSDPAIYTPWSPASLSLAVARQPRQFCGYEKTAALVSNSCANAKPLDHILGKAWSMFSSRAYIHQYSRHGLAEEDFLDAFVSLENVIAAYGKL